MKNLKNQVIIVTGGAAGIGNALTTVLSQRGASLVVVDISEAGVRKLKNPIQINLCF